MWDKTAIKRAQKSVKGERRTVVTFTKELEGLVLKDDPDYVSVETDSISTAVVERFDHITLCLHEETTERDAIRFQYNELKEQLTNVTNEKLHLNRLHKGALRELDVVRDDDQRKGKQLMTEQVKGAKLQGRYDQIPGEFEALEKELRRERTSNELDKERLHTKNQILQAERNALTTELEANQTYIKALEAQASDQWILADVASQREAGHNRTIESLQKSIKVLQQPRVSEYLGNLATAGPNDNARRTRQTMNETPIPVPSNVDTDEEAALRHSFKRPRVGSAGTSGKDRVSANNAWQGLGFVEQDDESIQLEDGTGRISDNDRGCVTARVSQLRNETDDTALPVEVRQRLLKDIKYWDKRSKNWAS